MSMPGYSAAQPVLRRSLKFPKWVAAGVVAASVAGSWVAWSAQEPPGREKAKATGETLRLGDSSPAVEDLQRRLNARLEPSPGLDVDGDFGPATRAAVLHFQRSRG